MSSSIMLDIETLATTPDAVVLTIGAVKFDPYADTIDKDNGLYLRIDVDTQLTMGRLADDDTINWWGRQAEDVRDEALGDENRVSLLAFTQQLNKYLVATDKIWCQGPVFDIVILENLYSQLATPVPWNYWQIMDSRTLFNVHGDPRVKGKAGLHNALEDCVSQAGAVQKVYKQNNLTRNR